MRRNRRLAGWIVLLLLALPAAGRAEIALSGSVGNQARLRILQNDMPEDYDWDFTMLMSTVNVIGKAADENMVSRLYLDMDLRYDPTGVFEETDDLEWRLREAYGQFDSQYVSFRVGKIIYSWGKADEFNPTDLLNPEDMRWMTTFDYLERKKGVYSADLMLTYDAFTLEAAVAPIFEPNIWPGRDSEWLPWELGLFYGIIDTFPDYADFQTEQVPDYRIQNANLSARLNGTVGPVDFSLVFFDGFDQYPYYRIKIDTDVDHFLAGSPPLTLKEVYQRYQAYGGSLAFTLGKFAFRAEGAYYTERTYNNEIDESFLKINDVLAAYQALLALEDFAWYSESPSFSVVGGVDFRESTWLYINLQYVHNQILDYEEENIYNEYEGNMTGKFSVSWLDDELTTGAKGLYNLYHQDWFANPYVSYKFSVDFTAELGGHLFGGEERTRFGCYDDNDYLYTKFAYFF